MPPVKIGVQTASLRRPLRKAIEAAGRIGADGIEIDLRHELPYADLSQTAIRQLAKLLDDNRLAVGAAAFPLRRGLGDPVELDRRVAAVMGAMTAASSLGARVVIVPIGRVPSADSDESPTAGPLVESVTAIAAHGDRVGARLAVATGAEPPEDLAALIAELPEAVLGVSLNPAGLLAAGHDPVAAAQTLGHTVSHAHANDAVRDFAAGNSAAGNSAAGGVVGVPLGRGGADFPSLLATLEQHAYRGWITVERTGSPSPEEELGNAVAYLRTLLRDG